MQPPDFLSTEGPPLTDVVQPAQLLSSAALERMSKQDWLTTSEVKKRRGSGSPFRARTSARKIARRVQPRSSKSIKSLPVACPEDQARNLLLEGENLHDNALSRARTSRPDHRGSSLQLRGRLSVQRQIGRGSQRPRGAAGSADGEFALHECWIGRRGHGESTSANPEGHAYNSTP
jgi:hypothetical protein